MPPTPGALVEQFTALLAGWEWDVALLQEVPPWWPDRLARASGAQQRTVLTSRNALLAVRRALASRRPELMKSNGGASNAILARAEIVEHRALRLRFRPERRVAQLARLGGGMCVVNFHGSVRVPLAEAELERLWAEALGWAGSAPLIVGGDLNLRRPSAPDGVVQVARRDVDHLFARGLEAVADPVVLDRHVALPGGVVELSDHPPLRVEVSAGA
jgi:endonuclease/exonuclease/phosphatase family metal-dependent hydrolase